MDLGRKKTEDFLKLEEKHLRCPLGLARGLSSSELSELIFVVPGSRFGFDRKLALTDGSQHQRITRNRTSAEVKRRLGENVNVVTPQRLEKEKRERNQPPWAGSLNNGRTKNEIEGIDRVFFSMPGG